jgi:hypothetical protein
MKLRNGIMTLLTCPSLPTIQQTKSIKETFILAKGLATVLPLLYQLLHPTINGISN